MTRLLTASVLLLFAAIANAGPTDWLKRQAREHPVRTKLAVASGAALVHGLGLLHCSRINVELCDGHYGARWGIFGAATATNLVMQLVGQKIGGIEGNAIAYGSSSIQLGHGIFEWHIKPEQVRR